MKLGSFIMPNHPPERAYYDGIQEDLQEIEYMDKLGYEESWIGEHFTSNWEPCPAPDLLIAQALLKTKHMKLGPLGHLLPYHNPVELAHRVAYLDHMAKGRYQLGVGISALPSDHNIFGIDKLAKGSNRSMTFESIKIMTDLWLNGPQNFNGEYFNAGEGKTQFSELGFHLKPYQLPHPPIAIAGLTPNSANHELCGEKGYLPVSLGVSPNNEIVKQHWDAVEKGAQKSGLTPKRSEWRIIKDIYVAATDEEALSLAKKGMMGRCWREFLLPIYLGLGLGPLLKIDPNMKDEEITLDYIAEHLWITGSPDTVANKINKLYDDVGGFGYIIMTSYDSKDEKTAWNNSLALLKNQVLPKCKIIVD
ncbi:LLM class flavin-dependent oxidoreductase [Flammeovirga pectinis]|uniref:LLM class flavin-dependent oxidoreductase n=1 Tax=Flammeovirga pectinis TaxID=2494373 RepID=A0A3S9P6Q9_9BACT|nr:LLM class flavin-dependent oxidoreductase [Flammeovirga pectinis]AZQ63784.1 LLM class flavin-dependent oxidoreductase [Flammeovirga pectinis]